jgi:hypothetical protein
VALRNGLRSNVIARPAANRIAIALAWTIAVVGLIVTWRTWLTDLTYPGMPWQDPHEMSDFRDTIWAPGHWLLAGGNPYDPAPYLAANPGSQEFDPYAPAWLLLSAALAPLPFTAAAAAYLVLGAVLAVVLIRLLLRWADPRLLALGTPIGLIWLELWSPGRYSLQNGGTLLIFIGWVLVMRALVRRQASWGALGLALVLLKPQFGLPLIVVLLAAGRWRTAVNGLLLLAAASVPALTICVIAAGGPVGFLESIGRLLSYATSADAATGLLSPFNDRIDLLGLFGRFGVAAPGWAQLLVGLLATAAACLFARRGTPVTMTAGIAAVVLLGLVHQPYDAVIMLTPLVVGLPAAMARLAASEHLSMARRFPVDGHTAMQGRELIVWALAAVPVIHLHRVTTLVLSKTGADLVDVMALTLCTLAVLIGVTLHSTGTIPFTSMPSTRQPSPDDNAPT